ncbi:MAG: hypothetical protein Tsb0016_05170 [Sphingomonadales bacterium]
MPANLAAAEGGDTEAGAAIAAGQDGALPQASAADVAAVDAATSTSLVATDPSTSAARRQHGVEDGNAVPMPERTAQPAAAADAPAAMSEAGAVLSDIMVAAKQGLPQPALQQALATVESLRARGGAYAPGLRDALLDLGFAFREAGERAQAVRAFAEALYVARANHGLYALEQIPAIEGLIQENRALGRGDAVLNHQQLLYWVSRRQFGENDPRLLPHIDRIAKTYMQIGRDGLAYQEVIDIREANEMLDKAVAIVEENFGRNDPLLIDVLNRVVQTNYAFAAQTMQLPEFRALDMGPRRQVVAVDEQSMAAFALIMETQSRGDAALKRIREIYEAVAGPDPASAAYAQAFIRIQQGDWKQIFGRGDGRREYLEAYALLRQTERGDQFVDQFFGQPRILPVPAVTMQANDEHPVVEPVEANDDRIIEIAFDVTASGRVRNVELTRVPEGMDEHAKTLRDNILEQRFRPKVENGDTVTSRVVRHSFVDERGSVFMLNRVVDGVYAALLPQRRKEARLDAGSYRQ